MPGYILDVPVQSRAVSRPLWRALAAAKAPASIRELHNVTAAHPNAIQLRLKRWERAGLVTVLPTRPRRFIMADTAATPPIMRADGTVHRRNTSRQRLWTAMRVHGSFNLPTLLFSANTTRRSAEDFINVLCRAGYMKRLVSKKVNGDWSTYQLVKRSGRTAPIVRHSHADAGHRVLIDPNDGTSHDISPGRVSLRKKERSDSHVLPSSDGGEG